MRVGRSDEHRRRTNPHPALRATFSRGEKESTGLIVIRLRDRSVFVIAHQVAAGRASTGIGNFTLPYQSLKVSSEALPPAAVVFTVKVFSVVNRGR